MQESKIPGTCRVRRGLLWFLRIVNREIRAPPWGQQPKHLRDLPKTDLTSLPSCVDH